MSGMYFRMHHRLEVRDRDKRLVRMWEESANTLRMYTLRMYTYTYIV